MKNLLLALLAMVGMQSVCAADFTPSTIDDPVWYQLKAGDNYLGWQDYGAIYAKIEDMTLASVDNPDVLQWAFIAEGEGYKLYNKANNLYLGVNSGYVNVSADAVVWTVTESGDEITLSCADGNLYTNYFVQVGTNPATHFIVVPTDNVPTAITSVTDSTPHAEPYDLLGRRITTARQHGKKILIENGRVIMK